MKIEHEVISKAMEYILLHIGENITLEQVAKHCNMSISYFSKLFKEQTGESVYAFIKRIKMEQSAFRLKIEAKRSITEIGEDFGYSSSNYSSAFTGYHKRTPSKFRRDLLKYRHNRNKDEIQKIVKHFNERIHTEIKPDYLIMYERIIDKYTTMPDAWFQFLEKHKNEYTKDTLFFERTFNDPTITEEDRCIYDIGMTMNNPEKYKTTSVLEGGRFLICPYKGYINTLCQMYIDLFSIWFPQSKYQLDERCSYVQYYDVSEDGYMIFDFCIPIKG